MKRGFGRLNLFRALGLLACASQGVPASDAASLHAVLPIIVSGYPTNLAYLPGAAVEFGPVIVFGPPVERYQWQKNGRDIPGATNRTHRIPVARVEDAGDYRVVVSSALVTDCPSPEGRLLPRGGFLIEAEDYNYGRGQSLPAAGTMPYFGGAYDGLPAFVGVDYQNADGNDSDLYRTTAQGGTDTAPTNVNIVGNDTDRFRGEWDVVVNHRIGWASDGDWQRYTRTLSRAGYEVLAALSHPEAAPGQLRASLDLVEPGGALRRLGSFEAPGSGGLGANDLVPMRNGSGGVALVELNGVQTLQFNLGSGDFDFLLLHPVAAIDCIAAIGFRLLPDGLLELTFPACATLERADAVEGPFRPLPGAMSPQVFRPDDGAGFFRLAEASLPAQM